MQRYVQIFSLDEARDMEPITAFHKDNPSKNYQFTKGDIEKALAASEEYVRGECALLVWRDISDEAIESLLEKRDAATDAIDKAILDYKLGTLKDKMREEENKQHICELLLPALQATRNLHDLKTLTYSEDEEIVIATFDSGWTKKVNVACDSGIAMIRDILKQIV